MHDIQAMQCFYLRQVQAEGLQCTLEFTLGAVGDFVPGQRAMNMQVAVIGVLFAPAE